MNYSGLNVKMSHRFKTSVVLPLAGALCILHWAPRTMADNNATMSSSMSPTLTPVTTLAPKATVLEIKTISLDPEHYHGWPTLMRRKNGQLVVVYSGGREAHVDPFGRVEMMVSDDDGKTWSWPRILLDSDLDDRDAGILETSKGTLIVTTFTSLAYEGYLASAKRNMAKGTPSKGWTPERIARWELAQKRLTQEQRMARLGVWTLRSTDGGLTWGPQTPVPVTSPHGPIQLQDGRLFYPGAEQDATHSKRGFCESKDDGKTWHWLADLPIRPGDDPKRYGEMHAVEVSKNQIIVQIRNENTNYHGETLQTESKNGGKTWTMPHSIGVWGLPSHLLKLRNGDLLMTYGYRREPFGNQARLSKDGGKTWSEPITISADGASGDLGYPSTVELPDGTFLSVWYERLDTSDKAVLRQAHWKLD